MKRNIVTAFLSIAGGRVAIIVVSALVTPFLVRYLARAEYGAYGVVMAVFGMLMILVSSGINSGVRKYLAEDRDDENWASNVFGFYFRVAFALAVVPAAVFAVAAHTGFVGGFVLGPEFVPYFYLLAVLTLAAQFREYVRRALMGLELEHISEPIKVLHKVAFGVVAVTLAYLGYGVEGVLAGEIVASFLAFVVAFALISREVSLSKIVRPLPSEFPKRELFSFNYLTVVYIFLLTSMYHVDVLMLNEIVNSQTTGVYKGALVIVQFLWLVPRSVQSVLIQSTSGLWADDNVEKVNEMASKATRYTLVFTLLLAIGLGALATDFVPLYLSDDYADAVVPVLLLLPGTLGFAVARPIFAISHAKGELKTVIAATGASALINLALNAVLIPLYGMTGAAVATSIGYGSLPFFHYWGARNVGYDPFQGARLSRIAVTGVLAGIPIVGLALAIENRYLSLLVVPVVGFAIYSSIALLTRAIDLEEVLSVLVALPGPVGSHARRLRSQIGTSPDPLSPFAMGSGSILRRGLLGVGILMFVAGLAFSLGFQLPDVSIAQPNVTATDTATPLPDDDPPATTTATPTPDSSPPRETDTPPPTTAPGDSSTPTPDDETATPTPDTPTSTDGNGTPPDDTPTDSPTPSATPTNSPTPTDSPTESPTNSPTPTDSPTESPTNSPTPTDASASGSQTTSTMTAGSPAAAAFTGLWSVGHRVTGLAGLAATLASATLVTRRT